MWLLAVDSEKLNCQRTNESWFNLPWQNVIEYDRLQDDMRLRIFGVRSRFTIEIHDYPSADCWKGDSIIHPKLQEIVH